MPTCVLLIQQPCTYRAQRSHIHLRSMICHHGSSAMTGHYTAVVKLRAEWLLMSELSVGTQYYNIIVHHL